MFGLAKVTQKSPCCGDGIGGMIMATNGCGELIKGDCCGLKEGVNVHCPTRKFCCGEAKTKGVAIDFQT